MLAALIALRQEDLEHFESRRAQLKRAGCRITALDKALAKKAGDDSGRRLKQADLLIELAQEAELFHSPDGTTFADLVVNGHRETRPVQSKDFKHWLVLRFKEATGGVPNSEARKSALTVLEATGCHPGPEREVYTRVGELEGKLYLDSRRQDLAGRGDRQ